MALRDQRQENDDDDDDEQARTDHSGGPFEKELCTMNLLLDRKKRNTRWLFL